MRKRVLWNDFTAIWIKIQKLNEQQKKPERINFYSVPTNKEEEEVEEKPTQTKETKKKYWKNYAKENSGKICRKQTTKKKCP